MVFLKDGNRILALLLSIALLLSMGISAFAEETEAGELPAEEASEPQQAEEEQSEWEKQLLDLLQEVP